MDAPLPALPDEPTRHSGELIVRKPSFRDTLLVQLDRHPGRTLLLIACAGVVTGRLLRLAFRRTSTD